MSSLHWVDYAIILIIGLSILTGLFRGFVKEIIALSVWILAIWLAFHYSTDISSWFQSYVQDKTARTIMAFVAIVVVTVLTGGLLNTIFGFILHRSGLSGTDRLLGMGFGFMRGVFIVSLLMLVMKMTSLPYQEYSHQSKLYAQFNPFVEWLYGFTPEFMKKMSALEQAIPTKTGIHL
jgi:membrane protein required for colicin V production